MSLELDAAPEPVKWLGNRNIIVPPGIIPVRRVSPIPLKKRTPCRPWPDGEPVYRAGGREWFSDRLFADTETRDLRASCGSSIAAHASCFIGLLVLLAGQPAPTTPTVVREPLRMPVFVALIQGDGGAGAARTVSAPLAAAVPERQVAPPAKRRIAEATGPSPLQAAAPVPPAATLETAPESEQPHDANANADAAQAHTESAERTSAGAVESATGGVGEGGGAKSGGDGIGNDRTGAGGGSAGIAMSPGPYRPGQGIEPPRKIKDVRPIYPSGALALRAIGTVVIEAIVGADGKVHEATVLHSIPQLDQAALDAVRQWEFAPSRLNGVAVAVIVTVLVKFTLY